MCFSSTTTVLPTTLNNAQAVSRWLASANLPLHMPVMPQPSTQGVFGMARTTGTSPPSAFSIWLVGTDAATEMINCLLEMLGRIFSMTSCTTCGFTQTKMMSAPRTAAALSVLTGTRFPAKSEPMLPPSTRQHQLAMTSAVLPGTRPYNPRNAGRENQAAAEGRQNITSTRQP